MNLKKLQERLNVWNKAYKPKRKRTAEALMIHLTEELGEVAACLRSGQIGRTYKLDEYGLKHPEGLGSEIADAIGILIYLGDIHGLDVSEDIEIKVVYLEQKLIAKEAKRGRRR